VIVQNLSIVSSEFKRERVDLRKKLQEVPHKPGVYLMHDRLNRIIYVGKARDLRKRLSNYFMPSRKMTADLKTRTLIASIWDFEYHTVRNEPESLLLEGKLIKEYRPKFNVAFRDDKRFLLLKVNLNETCPRFQLTRNRREDGARYFGPFPHSGALRETLNWMNKTFALRTCRPLVPGEIDYKHCNDDVIRNCSAPCIGKVNEAQYKENVLRACAFLDGDTKDHLAEIEAAMLNAAENMEFEEAARYRDMLDNFKKTLSPTRQFTRGRGVPRTSNINPMEDVNELAEMLNLGTPPLIMECFDISNVSNTYSVASMVRFKNGVPDNRNYRRYRIKSVKGQDDFASMAEVVRRRYSRILLEGRAAAGDDSEFAQDSPFEALQRLGMRLEDEEEKNNPKTKFVRIPDLVIVDGGKGQLSSATKELQRLGLHLLPIIGLAKQHEEIYRPGISEPLVLPHEMGALRLLQRIRDEAHRFANGYHQILSKRRVEESILDDCPGISKTRKQALLKKFGSLTRLRKATHDDIAAISGISSKIAEAVVEYLKGH
jgi:excinuclease ABC subunit C